MICVSELMMKLAVQQNGTKSKHRVLVEFHIGKSHTTAQNCVQTMHACMHTECEYLIELNTLDELHALYHSTKHGHSLMPLNCAACVLSYNTIQYNVYNRMFCSSQAFYIVGVYTHKHTHVLFSII